MKWYIFNKDNEPLTFDGKAIEFKNMESAKAFYETTKGLAPACFLDGKVEPAILFYDGGHIAFDSLTKEQLEGIEKGFYDNLMEEIKNISGKSLSH